jgi:uncharacterized protein (TIGR02246 family)
MKLTPIFVMCVALFGAAGAINGQTNPKEEQAVRKVLRDFHEVMNARDLKAFAQFFAEDAEFVNVTATYAKGRDAIVKMHDRAFNVVFKDVDFKSLDAKMPEPVVTIRFLRPDIAIVHNQIDPGDCPPCAAAAAAMGMPKPGKDSRQVMIFVLSKHAGNWLIDAVQTTVWGLVPPAPQ